MNLRASARQASVLDGTCNRELDLTSAPSQVRAVAVHALHARPSRGTCLPSARHEYAPKPLHNVGPPWENRVEPAGLNVPNFSPRRRSHCEIDETRAALQVRARLDLSEAHLRVQFENLANTLGLSFDLALLLA